MKVYALFVRLDDTNLNGGWRFEGFTVNEHSVQTFINDVKKEIVEMNRDLTVLIKTIDYKVVELDI